MPASEKTGPEVELLRVRGLAAQLLEEICERTDGCVRAESRENGYALIFAPGTGQIDAWQRVHDALLQVDPGAERLTLVAAQAPSPRMATEIVGSATRVDLNNSAPAG